MDFWGAEMREKEKKQKKKTHYETGLKKKKTRTSQK